MVLTPYLSEMDAQWFKTAQKKAGLTSFDLGAAIGRDRTAVSRIINGTQKMTLEQARIFSERLGVPLTEMVARAGLADRPVAEQLAPGYSEGDVERIDPETEHQSLEIKQMAMAFGVDRPGVVLWKVKSRAMVLAGMLAGDLLFADTMQSERAKAGDLVVASIFNHAAGTATTVLRRFEPPVLVAASVDPTEQRVRVVDGTNVVIRAKVVASWRA